MNKFKTFLNSCLMSFISFRSYGQWSVEKAHDNIYEGHDKNEAFLEIVRNAFKEEFPEDLKCFSFITNTELNKMVEILDLNAEKQFSDLACGRGGPGMWIAKKTGAKLTGIDISSSAINLAKKRISEFGLENQAEFFKGDFNKTNLKSSSYDGAVCVDSIWYAPDKTKAFKEINRILKKDSVFTFTTWDGNIPFMPKDHTGLLKDAGFKVEIYEESKGWKKRQLDVYETTIKMQDTLIKNMGKKYAMPLIREAKAVIPVLEQSKRVFAAAKKL